MNANTIKTLDLLDGLDTGICGDCMNDYRTSECICDIVSEIADNNVSIYYSDILDFIRENPEALADVVDEGLYEVTAGSHYDLYEHAQAAEFMVNERDIYDHLHDSLMCAAINYIRYDLEREEIPEELADLLDCWCDDIDIDDRMSNLMCQIDEYFAANEE